MLRHPEDARGLSDQELGWLALAMRGDPRVSLGSVLEDVALEEAQLWEVRSGDQPLMLIVTRIIHYELCDVFEIQLCGGTRLRECLRLLPELERHAYALGCQMVELRGRAGWQRVLDGYRVRGIAFEKEL